MNFSICHIVRGLRLCYTCNTWYTLREKKKHYLLLCAVALRCFVAFCFIVLQCNTLSGQSNSYPAKIIELRSKDGNVIDMYQLIDWPDSLPVNSYAFTSSHSVRLEDYSITVHLSGNLQNRLRSNVGVYYAPTLRISEFRLYRTGMGFDDFHFPIDKEGFYIVIAINKEESFTQIFQYQNSIINVSKKNYK